MVVSKIHIFRLILVLCIFSAQSAKVTWRPNTSFNLPSNFADEARPCGAQNVHFPSNMVSAVEISDTNEVNTILLPMDGELQLNEYAKIYFGPKDKVDVACPKNDAYYIDRSKFSWLQADVWESDRHTAATPDAQRVPCFDDDVVFPKNSQFSVRLPNFKQHVGSINLGGTTWDLDSFKEQVIRSEGQRQSFILNDFLGLGLEIGSKSCQSRAGCPCQENATRVDCSLKVCDAPRCRNPVTPAGNCCPICGGVLEFDININTFNLVDFTNQVEKIVEANGGASAITYHVGLLWKTRVQVVMVDKGEYDSVSTLALHILARSMSSDFASSSKHVLLSGTPLSEVGMSGKVMGFAFLTVLLVFAVLYVWYERPDLVSAVPLHRVRPQRSSTTMFTRFQNRTNSITSFMSRGSVAFRSSFRNPMFASKRGSVAKSEDGVQENKDSSNVASASHSFGQDDEISQVSLIPDLE